MNITELIKNLEELREKHGDLPVYKEYDCIAVDFELVKIDRMPTTWSISDNVETVSGIFIE